MSRSHAARDGGLKGARVVVESEVLDNSLVLWRDGSIIYVGSPDHVPAEASALADAAVDAGGSWVLPGFIDMHVHGGFGSDFMDATVEAFDAIAAFHGRNGTTGLLATTVTASPEALLRVLETANVVASRRESGGSELYGVHLEGPFISPKWPGAQNPDYISAPRTDWLEEWSARFPGLIRMMTLAPEQPGAMAAIAWLTQHGIIASAGHTDATYEEMTAAADQGLQHAVHTFNAMRGLHHREPGTVGAVLTDERICAEAIADGVHVHPSCIRLLAQLKTQHNLVLITDAMSAAGLGNGEYVLGGLDVVVSGNEARLKHGGALAGSTLTMIDAFRYVVRTVGLTVPQTSVLASGNPARRLGLYREAGSIAVGKRADLLLVGAGLELRQVWTRGTAYLN